MTLSNRYRFIICQSLCAQKYIAENCQCQSGSIGYFLYSNMRTCIEKINNTIPYEDFVFLPF